MNTFFTFVLPNDFLLNTAKKETLVLKNLGRKQIFIEYSMNDDLQNDLKRQEYVIKEHERLSIY